MSQSEIVISGFGGQGALFAGQILASAGMAEAKHVTWLPSYGPEMRGGTAHVTVIIADEPIGSPIVQQPKIVIALNKPSVTKYEPLVQPGGLLIVNTTLVDELPTRTDLRLAGIPATETAETIGSSTFANIVAIGAMLAIEPILDRESVSDALRKKLSDSDEALLALDIQALDQGWALGLTVEQLVAS